MTVSSSTNSVILSANGTDHSFAFTFKIFAASDLKVIVRSAAGVETVKTLNSEYIIADSSVGNANGGNVLFKFNTGTSSDAHYSTTDFRPASGEKVILRREQPQTQGLDLVANDPFPAESFEESLDKLTFMVQDVQEAVDRSLKFSRSNLLDNSGSTISSTYMDLSDDVTARANKVLSFNSLGEPIATQTLGSFKGNWAASTLYAERDLVKDTSTNNIFIVLSEHTSSGSQPLTTNPNSDKYAVIIDYTNYVNLTVSGTLTAAAFDASDGDITNVGSISVDKIKNDATDIHIDADGTILLDADNVGLIKLHDGGVPYGNFKSSTGQLVISSGIGDGTAALTFSGANVTAEGNLTINGDLDVTGSFDMSDANITNVGSIALDTITSDASDITLDASGSVILDGSTSVIFKDNGTSLAEVVNSGTNTFRLRRTTDNLNLLTFLGSRNASFGAGALFLDDVIIQSNTSATSVGPILDLYRNNTSPADDDLIGKIVFSGKASNGDKVDYYEIFTQILETDNSKTGSLKIKGMTGGNSIPRMDFNRYETVINEDGNNLSFRVESNSDQNTLVVKNTARVGIKVADPTVTFDVAGDGKFSTDLSIGDDLSLISDAAVLNFGADSDVSLTHVADIGLLLNSTRQLQFGDSGTYIHQSADGVLDLVSDNEIEINGVNIDINSSGTISIQGATTFTDTTTINDNFILQLNGSDKITWDSSNERLTFEENVKLNFDGDLHIYHDNNHSYIEDVGVGNLILRASSGSDIILKGHNTETVTVDDAKVLLAGTTQLQFGDSGTYIHQSADGVLDLVSDTEIEINATTIDINGNVDVTGTVTADGLTVDKTDTGTYSSTAIDDTVLITRKNSSGTNNQVVGIKFDVTQASGSTTGIAGISAVQPTNVSSADLVFQTRNSGTIGERMRIDSSGNVGIGTTSVGAKLNVIGAGRFDNSNSTPVRLHINNSGSNDYASIYADTASAFKNLVINPDGGNVGIGTSPSQKLHVSGGNFQLVNGSSTLFLGDGPNLVSNAPTSSSAIRFDSDNLLFSYSNNERMRINSSGNLLVGKTSSATNTVGIEIDGANGVGVFTRDGNAAIEVNRKTSDGTIINLRKDGSTVGSIGVADSGDRIYLGGSGANRGIAIDSSASVVIPSTNTGGLADALIGLGTSTARFTELFLSSSLRLTDSSNTHKYSITSLSSDALQFYDTTANAERMRIDSSGNVLVGTTSLTTGTLGSSNTFLELSAGTNNGSGTLILSRNTTTDGNEVGGVRFANQNNGDDDGLDADGRLIAAISARLQTSDSNAGDDSGGHLVFYTKPEAGNYAERMRIDSSGRLLLGTTSTTLYDATSGGGILAVPNSSTTIARQSTGSTQPLLILNETGVDGTLQEFRKDGSIMGRISSTSTGVALGTPTGSGSGLHLISNAILPSTSTGGTADGIKDLGSDSSRFKDLYLSGGAYIGGTGSANYLDDYEEGTWTPNPYGATTAGTYSNLARAGRYIKVGDMVYISGYIYGSITGAAGEARVGGLPFQKDSNDQGLATVQWNNCPFDTIASDEHHPVGLIYTDYLFVRASDRVAQGAYYTCVWNNSTISYYRFSATYREA